ncbi:MAG: chlorophyll a/b-binding protein [Thermosynechococcaceae cyanobacterium MS004]|nr:chlorophyll a/b-binding protein [Thermosynechococcaceae cyanobacterium MS004]
MTQSAPKPVSQPTQLPRDSTPKYGFNDYVERLNGRAAMIGFVAAVVIEAITGKGVLTWLGF